MNMLFGILLALLNLINWDTFSPHYSTQKEISLLFGGDVFLARKTHLTIEQKGDDFPFQNLKDWLDKADYRLVNLECVVASGGVPVNKGERSAYYYRARPEMLEVLKQAGIDGVATANNHSGDYGADGIREEMFLLQQANIDYFGIGSNLAEARQFKIIEVEGIKIALIGADASQKSFCATKTEAGTNWLDEKDPDLFVHTIKTQVEVAKQYAHIVLMTIHWGKNGKKVPTNERKVLARRLLQEAKLDGILGHGSHLFQGIEIVDEKPIIYDAGNLLLDYEKKSWQHQSFLFQLSISKKGINKIQLLPVLLKAGYTVKADSLNAESMLARMTELSKSFQTTISPTGVIYLEPPYQSRRLKKWEAPLFGHDKHPDNQLPNYLLTQVPSNVLQEPITFSNGITLLGYQIHRKKQEKGKGFFVSTYWTCTKSITESYNLSLRVVPKNQEGPIWGNKDSVRDHQPADWAYPTYRWKVGEIVKDYYYIRGHKESALDLHRIYYGWRNTSNPLEDVRIIAPKKWANDRRKRVGEIEIVEEL